MAIYILRGKYQTTLLARKGTPKGKMTGKKGFSALHLARKSKRGSIQDNTRGSAQKKQPRNNDRVTIPILRGRYKTSLTTRAGTRKVK